MSLPYEIEFDDRKTHAYARITAAAIDSPMAYAYLAEIVHKCAEVRRKKLLLERDIPEYMSDSDMNAALISLLSMGSGMKIAIVNLHPELGDALEKAVSLACSGRTDCRYFEDSGEAERWLLASNGS